MDFFKKQNYKFITYFLIFIFGTQSGKVLLDLMRVENGDK